MANGHLTARSKGLEEALSVIQIANQYSSMGSNLGDSGMTKLLLVFMAAIALFDDDCEYPQ
jgi:hypothetical protein